MNENLCPIEVEHTRNMALSNQDAAILVRINNGLEACSGLPGCEGPVALQVERGAVTGFLLGKYTTKFVCPRVASTLQT